jgi:hypothetical protein
MTCARFKINEERERVPKGLNIKVKRKTHQAGQDEDKNRSTKMSHIKKLERGKT